MATLATDVPPQQTQRTGTRGEIPHDALAERAVLGSILINPASYYEVADVIEPGEFYIVRNRWVYEAIQAIVRAGQEVDYVTLCGQLQRNAAQFKEIGGPAYLTALMNEVPTAVNAVSYAHMVHDKHESRRGLDMCSKLATAIYKGQPLADLIGVARDFIDGAKAMVGSVKKMNDVVGTVWDYVDTCQNTPGTLRGLTTGIDPLDMLTRGLAIGEESVWFGFAGDGKTTYMGQVMLDNARTGHGGMYVSMETPSEIIVLRMACGMSGVQMEKARSYHGMSDDEAKRLSDAFAELRGLPIVFTDGVSLTVQEIEAEMRRQQPELVVVDHIKLLGDKKDRGDNDTEYLNRMYRSLRNAGKRAGAHVAVIAHRRKTGENRDDKRPILADLEYVGAQDADLVVGMYCASLHEDFDLSATELCPDGVRRPRWQSREHYEQSVLFRILKDRNGRTGDVEGAFDKACTRFVALQKNETSLNE